MVTRSSIHTSCLLMTRLAAIWSTLPPSVVSPSPVMHRAPGNTMSTHAQVTPSGQTKPLLPSINNVTVAPNIHHEHDEQLKPTTRNFKSVLQGRTLSNNALEGISRPNNQSNVTNSRESENDTLTEAYTYSTDYSDTVSNTTEDWYSWNDTFTDNSTDVFKVYSKIYRYQMIKVGVLCTVMSVIILSTCKMLLQVFAQYAGREKLPDEI
nr:uncharacterized protein LOC123758328 [Procambarus clarkii]